LLELDAIARQFKRLTYQIEPIRPLPLPSHAGKNNAQAGLIYDISVRDQVAWIAFLNVIGPGLDAQMPPWSYGGRLHRSTWDEQKNGPVITRNGGYRHSSGRLYRNSPAAWSLYQRHIFLTDRAMAGLLVPNLPPSFYNSILTGNAGKAIRLQATAPAQKKAH
jgi:hypothetical protein